VVHDVDPSLSTTKPLIRLRSLVGAI